ncbi:MAG TPA: Asp-tRNA(Asn)/Glu-tRNA(Gln) amidotransferase subunit GatA [Flavisolibacter sp.]|nr:Asp-tRNA(Asn)/Glu-tRNA(Gln) amidotransferase subunit GatA [Flavisolibacter sp.]
MINYQSIEAYHDRLKDGQTSCKQAVQHCLFLIEQYAGLNAFVEVFAEEAIERAILLDSQEVKGKLHGVVIGIKDNICYKDHKVTAASRILDGFTSLYSATAVERLLAEGAIIIGRQNCDEFGMGSTNENSSYGPTLHPDDPTRVPGGSSGGSAVAVKKGMCMVSLGSDTGGSVRLPADYCGIVGLKPGYGTVSRHGLIAYGSSFDQIGILANNVADVALVLDVISGPDDFDSTAITVKPTITDLADKEEKFRIAYFPEWIDHPSIDPEISAEISHYIEKLKGLGHEVRPVNFDLTEYIVPTYYILTTAEASSNLSRYDGIRYGKTADETEDLASFYRSNRAHGFGKEVKRRIMLGTFVLSSGYYDAYFTKAQQVRQKLYQQTQLIFSEFDFIIAPNAPGIAPLLGEKNKDPLAMYMGDIFTVFANLTGIPAISLPVFKHSSNLPFGLQVAAGGQNEVSLLRFTHQLMQQ